MQRPPIVVRLIFLVIAAVPVVLAIAFMTTGVWPGFISPVVAIPALVLSVLVQVPVWLWMALPEPIDPRTANKKLKELAKTKPPEQKPEPPKEAVPIQLSPEVIAKMAADLDSPDRLDRMR